MHDTNFLVIIILLAVLAATAFFFGRSTGADYWHKQCNQYSISAYATGYVPAHCVSANTKPEGES